MVQHYGEQYGGSLKLNIKLAYDPAIPLLDIYLEKKIPIQEDTCHPLFIRMLFMTAKTWKHSKCPSMGNWINKMWYNRILVTQKSEIMPFAPMWVDLEIIILSEASQRKTDIIQY